MVPLLGRVADGLRTASICDISCSRCELKSKPKGSGIPMVRLLGGVADRFAFRYVRALSATWLNRKIGGWNVTPKVNEYIRSLSKHILIIIFI